MEQAIEFPQGMRLRGKDNWVDWYHQLRLFSDRLKVTPIITGEMKIRTRSPEDEDDGPIEQISDRSPEELHAAPSQLVAEDALSLWLKTPTERHNKHRERVRLAMELVKKSVSPNIALEIKDETNPRTALRTISIRFCPSDVECKETALQKVSNLKIADYSTIGEYFHEVNMLAEDLSCAAWEPPTAGLYEDNLEHRHAWYKHNVRQFRNRQRRFARKVDELEEQLKMEKIATRTEDTQAIEPTNDAKNEIAELSVVL